MLGRGDLPQSCVASNILGYMSYTQAKWTWSISNSESIGGSFHCGAMLVPGVSLPPAFSR